MHVQRMPLLPHTGNVLTYDVLETITFFKFSSDRSIAVQYNVNKVHNICRTSII
jgi:hypothetical protein